MIYFTLTFVNIVDYTYDPKCDGIGWKFWNT